jgi:hypothetical protein
MFDFGIALMAVAVGGACDAIATDHNLFYRID